MSFNSKECTQFDIIGRLIQYYNPRLKKEAQSVSKLSTWCKTKVAILIATGFIPPALKNPARSLRKSATVDMGSTGEGLDLVVCDGIHSIVIQFSSFPFYTLVIHVIFSPFQHYMRCVRLFLVLLIQMCMILCCVEVS